MYILNDFLGNFYESGTTRYRVTSNDVSNSLRLMAHDLSSSFKFLVPDKSDRCVKLLVNGDSGTSNLDGELRSCAIGLIKGRRGRIHNA